MSHEAKANVLNDDVDAATVAAKKDTVLERLNKRNKDRQSGLDVKLEQRSKENLQLEGLDFFAQSFSERAREIESHLQNIEETALKNTSGAGSSNDLGPLFVDITMEIQELQRYLTSSTMFLADYKIKACQNIINELSNSCDQARLRLMPKKRFGFSGRKVAPKIEVNPKLADKVDSSEKLALSTKSAAFTWTLSNRQHEYICLRHEEVNGKDVTMSNLSDCLIELIGYAGSVQISNVSNCTLLCGPITRSMFAEHCHNLTLAVACQQLRLHSSSACRIYLHVTCRAIIEDCSQIEIAPYNYDYPAIETDFCKAGLDSTQNNYKDVADFNWLSSDVPSPNWKLLEESTQPDWREVRLNFKQKQSANNVTL